MEKVQERSESGNCTRKSVLKCGKNPPETSIFKFEKIHLKNVDETAKLGENETNGPNAGILVFLNVQIVIILKILAKIGLSVKTVSPAKTRPILLYKIGQKRD